MQNQNSFQIELQIGLKFLKNFFLHLCSEIFLIIFLQILICIGLSGYYFLLGSYFHEAFLSYLPFGNSYLLGFIVFLSLISSFLLSGWLSLRYIDPEQSLKQLYQTLPLKNYFLIAGLIASSCAAFSEFLLKIPVFRESVWTLLSLSPKSISAYIIGLMVCLNAISWALIPGYTLELSFEEFQFKSQIWKNKEKLLILLLTYTLLNLGLFFCFSLWKSLLLTQLISLLVSAVCLLLFSIFWIQILKPNSLTLKRSHHPRQFLSVLVLSSLGIGCFFWAQRHNQDLFVQYQKQYLEQVKIWADMRMHRKALWGKSQKGDGRDYYQGLILEPIHEQNKIDFSDINKIFQQNKIVSNNLFDFENIYSDNQEVIAKYAPLVSTIENAVNSETLSPLQTEFHLKAQQPVFANIQNLMRILIVTTHHQFETGQTQKGFTNLILLMRFAQDIRYNGTLVSDMVALVMQSTATQEYLRVANPQTLGKPLSEKLLLQWHLLSIDQNLLEGTFLREILFLNGVLLDADDLKDEFGEGILPSLLKQITLPYLLYTLELSQPLAKEMDRVIQTMPYKLSHQLLKKLKSELPQKNIILRLSLPTMLGAEEKKWLNKIRWDMAYLKTALIAWKHNHKNYPDKLQDLVPAIIPSLPIDPYSGKSYGYTLSKDRYELKSQYQEYMEKENADTNASLSIYRQKF
ncbi:hypothetical protein COW36_07530 [bacterium (Candidatus Blackallbacteria) CG17_big_fil_post_rev_8_21_14_2_50_48_46]|uniref:Uncharacterized protein n=1 Tax=bacterium (Candidatus Blackallbacteria) CG17_big_fil_post_rev_8_21_14_2_50_48_46 TaxID=2014261 RepID=A0A2M7G6W0_9BACT|nr:MAG: hypothetical protein COW64_16630 [bacterium (Candidatus Blackallbacteria) CG18_big_fil_WC_8_21_14_2_50_49_26]PIW17787.1 MAG: hypothetical protein COW36_07530 [bacterium (Candidatus Blackallbacteria) CG17_big_fil_post_rev_8_21_14_2_50_48_46]PIW47346.1 MAG: hypothetical protein COW20_13055 [bacterium (Candidatus Blackallbacteria) CG13_big_fil_rev_8_21_14_2_50_49_14]